MSRKIDPNKIWVGDIVLVATKNNITVRVQEGLGHGASSKWTHIAGSIGGYDLVEGQLPKSRVCNLQADYVDHAFEIKILRPKYQSDADRIKVALWWATMNNLPYDTLQLAWFPFADWVGSALLSMKNLFNSEHRLICSELIANGFYKQGYNLFNRPASNILPADFDDEKLFQPISDIWM